MTQGAANNSNLMVRGAAQASLQTVLLLLMTGLVAVFYERDRAADLSLSSLECWSVSTVLCANNEEKCANSTVTGPIAGGCPFEEQMKGYYFYTHQGPTSLCNLVGQAPEFERGMAERDDLFSAMGIPFLLLSSQVITTAFFIGYIRYDSSDDSHKSASNLQKTLKRISLVVQLIFAGQGLWH